VEVVTDITTGNSERKGKEVQQDNTKKLKDIQHRPHKKPGNVRISNDNGSFTFYVLFFFPISLQRLLPDLTVYE
jgi:hypothetical protein